LSNYGAPATKLCAFAEEKEPGYQGFVQTSQPTKDWLLVIFFQNLYSCLAFLVSDMWWRGTLFFNLPTDIDVPVVSLMFARMTWPLCL